MQTHKVCYATRLAIMEIVTVLISVSVVVQQVYKIVCSKLLGDYMYPARLLSLSSMQILVCMLWLVAQLKDTGEVLSAAATF